MDTSERKLIAPMKVMRIARSGSLSLDLTWLAEESQPEVYVVLLVGLSVSSVGVHIDHSFAANMKQQP